MENSLRHKMTYKNHRNHIKNCRPCVDSSAPRGLKNNPFLKNDPTTRHSVQREINRGNEALVERMADIMRTGGPLCAANLRPKAKPVSKVKVQAKMRETARIERENKAMAHRLRNQVRSGVPTAKELAAEYAQKSRTRAAMSEASKRATRTANWRRAEDRRKALLEMRAELSTVRPGGGGGEFRGPGSSVAGPESNEESSADVGLDGESLPYHSTAGYSKPTLNGMGGSLARPRGVTGVTQLVSAKQIRATVAAYRGEVLPEWMTSRRGVSGNGRGTATSGGGGGGSRKFFPAARGHTGGLSMSHKGAPVPLRYPAFPM
mmetsp:Transcript_68272/g.154474  ORF Transcript_68272/g.154474 Transcript_68272/m.154474 type:complete len:319 (-) Transcript_68272:76-1032(-)